MFFNFFRILPRESNHFPTTWFELWAGTRKLASWSQSFIRIPSSRTASATAASAKTKPTTESPQTLETRREQVWREKSAASSRKSRLGQYWRNPKRKNDAKKSSTASKTSLKRSSRRRLRRTSIRLTFTTRRPGSACTWITCEFVVRVWRIVAPCSTSIDIVCEPPPVQTSTEIRWPPSPSKKKHLQVKT